MYIGAYIGKPCSSSMCPNLFRVKSVQCTRLSFPPLTSNDIGYEFEKIECRIYCRQSTTCIDIKHNIRNHSQKSSRLISNRVNCVQEFVLNSF